MKRLAVFTTLLSAGLFGSLTFLTPGLTGSTELLQASMSSRANLFSTTIMLLCVLQFWGKMPRG